MGYEYHEEGLTEECKNFHRAIKSLIEELEAIDWYNQRVCVTEDEELKSILAHNRDEEIEHAAMALEYLRRMTPAFDEELRTYLFTSGPITAIEEEEEGEGEGEGGPAESGDLGIGKS